MTDSPGRFCKPLPILFPLCWRLACFPMCSCSGGGTRPERCSSCHGEKLGFALYLFNLFLNGSVLQYVKSAWLTSTPDATNLGLYLSVAHLLKSTVKSWTSFAADSIALGTEFPWRFIAEMSTEAELTLTSIKSHFFYLIKRLLMSVL